MSNVKCQIPAFIENGKFHNTVSRTDFWDLATYHSEDFSLPEHGPRLCSCKCWADRTSLKSNMTLQSRKKIGYSLYLLYYPAMKLDTTTKRGKHDSPWLSMPILQLVSRAAGLNLHEYTGDYTWARRKEWSGERSTRCISEKRLRDAAGEWENWARLDMEHKAKKQANSS